MRCGKLSTSCAKCTQPAMGSATYAFSRTSRNARAARSTALVSTPWSATVARCACAFSQTSAAEKRCRRSQSMRNATSAAAYATGPRPRSTDVALSSRARSTASRAESKAKGMKRAFAATNALRATRSASDGGGARNILRHTWHVLPPSDARVVRCQRRRHLMWTCACVPEHAHGEMSAPAPGPSKQKRHEGSKNASDGNSGFGRSASASERGTAVPDARARPPHVGSFSRAAHRGAARARRPRRSATSRASPRRVSSNG